MQISTAGHKTRNYVQCYHCGENCVNEIRFDSRLFCCEGCKLVYELLSENNLCTYYSLNKSPGISTENISTGKFDYLDHEEVKKKLIQFSDGNQTHITFYIPKIHCSSCIWLLENLHKLNKSVISSTVNFPKKEATIVFNEQELKLSAVVELMAAIGYEPLISLKDLETKKERKYDKQRILKIGIAGFCFGNIMMLSFPEYFSLGNFYGQHQLKSLFSILNLVLALPVLFYAASDFFVSAWKGIRQKFLNIDIPIAFAILITFLRSVYEITSGTGSGYLDSMSGIVFFMLIGRYFQDITYDSISFERDYKSYFPIAVSVKRENRFSSVPVEELKKGDLIFLRNNELLPVDSLLLSDHTYIDYSFVTGESRSVKILRGELIYAGGRQVQGAVELSVVKEVSQSYLTALWNKDKSRSKTGRASFIHKISSYFTLILFIIALSAFCYWYASGNPTKALNALTTVLIVACPCALLLSATFTNGNIIRILGRSGFFIKNADVLEELAETDTIIFDKTGTITHGSSVVFKGNSLTREELNMVVALAENSTHPLSRKICETYPGNDKQILSEFEEIPGQGIKGCINNMHIQMGSSLFVIGKPFVITTGSSQVFVMINGELKGYFSIENAYRSGIMELVSRLMRKYNIFLLSGDNNAEKEELSRVFGNQLYFNQKPEDKSAFIRSLQEQGHKVLMIGDGLNDINALLSSNAGIAVSDNTNNFSPACDAILQGDQFRNLDRLLSFIESGRKIILASFILSILYNVVGLSFAVQGALSPVIAAILMPASSISIILLTTIASNICSKRIHIKK